MRLEIHPPEDILFTSDRLGFEGFRVVVVELPDEGETGSGQRGHPRFWFACRPVREKGRTILTFRESGESMLMSRVSLSHRIELSVCLGTGLRDGLAPLRCIRAFLRKCCGAAESQLPTFAVCRPRGLQLVAGLIGFASC